MKTAHNKGKKLFTVTSYYNEAETPVALYARDVLDASRIYTERLNCIQATYMHSAVDLGGGLTKVLVYRLRFLRPKQYVASLLVKRGRC